MNRSLSTVHEEQFGVKPDVVVSAPGRVNLIGEHTDYNQGLCLPVALPEKTSMTLTPSDHEQGRAFSVNFDDEADWSVGDQPRNHWTDYIVGTYTILAREGFDVPLADISVQSTIPIGGGVSSSAAFCVCLIRGLNALANLQLDAERIAVLAQAVENDFIGLPCGLMDQMASSVGNVGQPLLFDTRDNSTTGYALIPGHSIMVFNSGVERQLRGSEYADRREQCKNAASSLGVSSLRDITDEDVDGINDPLDQRRARHVVTENARVMDACQALKQLDSARLGQILNAGHASLRDDFEVSVPAVDALVETCVHAGALGARITGAGFGGCIVVLTDTDQANLVKEAALSVQGVSLVSEIVA